MKAAAHNPTRAPEILENVMDGEAIRRHLGEDKFTGAVDEKRLSKAIRDMCDRARLRVVSNFSGALPGPPRESPSVFRRILRLVVDDNRQP